MFLMIILPDILPPPQPRIFMSIAKLYCIVFGVIPGVMAYCAVEKKNFIKLINRNVIIFVGLLFYLIDGAFVVVGFYLSDLIGITQKGALELFLILGPIIPAVVVTAYLCSLYKKRFIPEDDD